MHFMLLQEDVLHSSLIYKLLVWTAYTVLTDLAGAGAKVG